MGNHICAPDFCLCDLARVTAERATLEAAIREATAMGWCYESRELLWGAVENDPARVTAAMEASAGYVAEAQAVLEFVEALEDVLRMASRIYWEAHPTLRKAGNWKLLGVALEAAADAREDYEPEKLRTSVGTLDLTIGAQDLP